MLKKIKKLELIQRKKYYESYFNSIENRTLN